MATIFILVFMIKMSRARWSKIPEEEADRKTTMMDREVAAGWFDKTRLDTEHKFVSFTHNVPDFDSRRDSNRSDRSSLLGMEEERFGSLNSEPHLLLI